MRAQLIRYNGPSGAQGQYHTIIHSGTGQTQSVARPVLVRYTLTRQQQQHHFQADLLGGVTWLRRSYHSEQRTIDLTQGTNVNNGYDDA